jgi:hypothetical protein
VKRPDWIAWWQQRVMPGQTEAPARVVPRPTTPRRTAGMYQPLHAYLQGRFADTAVLTFEQIESLLGFALPDGARTHDEWWEGRDADAGAAGHTDAWRLAGRTATPTLQAKVVAFERVSS